MSVSVSECECVCECVCERERERECVCVRERACGRENIYVCVSGARDTKREREREGRVGQGQTPSRATDSLAMFSINVALLSNDLIFTLNDMHVHFFEGGVV